MDIVGNAYAAVVALDPADGSVKWRFVAPNTAPIDVGPKVGPDGNIYGIHVRRSQQRSRLFRARPAGQPYLVQPGQPDYRRAYIHHEVRDHFRRRSPPRRNVVSPKRLHGVCTRSRSARAAQLWTYWDLQNTGATFPTMDPFNRVITAWPQTGLRAITADGVEDWIRVHPDQVNIERPAVDWLGNSYTGNASGVRLWSLDPAGNTRWIRPSEFPNGLDELGITPDDQIIVAGGSGGFGARASGAGATAPPMAPYSGRSNS